MIRNKEEIKDALKRLEKNLDSCTSFNCFGQDNKKQIQAMLDVIRNERSAMWINSNHLTVSEMFHEQPDNIIWQAAVDAREWLDGGFPIEDLLFNEVKKEEPNLLNKLLLL